MSEITKSKADEFALYFAPMIRQYIETHRDEIEQLKKEHPEWLDDSDDEE